MSTRTRFILIWIAIVTILVIMAFTNYQAAHATIYTLQGDDIEAAQASCTENGTLIDPNTCEANDPTGDTFLEGEFPEYWAALPPVPAKRECIERSDIITIASWEAIFVFEASDCLINIAPPWDLHVLLVGDSGARDRCDHMGGRYEYIGNASFNLNICWNVDY